MNVLAYCCESFARATHWAAGVRPFTCPPLDAKTFDWRLLRNRDLIYFDLHGMPGKSEWYGDERIVALTTHHIERADLSGTIVFAISCYLADEDSPMLEALLDAGARYVIGGDGRNWAGASGPLYGAALLGQWFRWMLLCKIDPLRALAAAKTRIKAQLLKDRLLSRAGRVMAAEDTLGFRAYYREET